VNVAARPVFFLLQFLGQADRFGGLRIKFWSHYQAGLLGELVENLVGEFLILGAVEDHARFGPTTQDKGRHTHDTDPKPDFHDLTLRGPKLPKSLETSEVFSQPFVIIAVGLEDEWHVLSRHRNVV